VLRYASDMYYHHHYQATVTVANTQLNTFNPSLVHLRRGD